MSALILLVIVVAWAVVLVPMLLRRHDQVSESRSVDRFETAMRVLSRRTETASAGREFVVPRRPTTTVTVTVNGTTAWHDAPTATREALLRTRDVAATPAVADDVPCAREAVALVSTPLPENCPAGAPEHPEQLEPSLTGTGQLRRRRRALLALTVLPIPLLALALLVSPWLWALQALADLLLVAFVLHLRQESARQRARRAHLARLARRARAAEQDAGSTAVQLRPAAWSAASAYARAAAAPEHLRQADGSEVVIEKQSDGSWLPVPVPVPTYLTAPPAPPSRPTGTPEPVIAQSSTPSEPVETVEPERRTAVNE